MRVIASVVWKIPTFLLMLKIHPWLREDRKISQERDWERERKLSEKDLKFSWKCSKVRSFCWMIVRILKKSKSFSNTCVMMSKEKGRGLEVIGLLHQPLVWIKIGDSTSGTKFNPISALLILIIDEQNNHEDLCRSLLGPELLIVNLTMSEEGIKKRISARHEGSQNTVDMLMVSIITLKNNNSSLSINNDSSF